jgi:DNA-binding LacI/PurR family transcriptional regulator
MGSNLKDVAALAGVSVKTVSNVVNGYVHVSATTRERVQAAIDELGYRPNATARSLRSGRSGVLALAVPELGVPYFAELASLVVDAAATHGYTVLIDQTAGAKDRELVVLGGIRHHLVDGVLFSPLALGVAELRRRTDATPMVLLGERGLRGPTDHVGIDNIRAAREATRHLAERGCRRIAAIGVQSVGTGARGSPTPGWSSTRPWCCRRRGSTAPRGTRRWPPCWSCPTRRTGCSASTTCSPSARCAACTPAACRCPSRSR